jgi:hypothetical protein
VPKMWILARSRSKKPPRGDSRKSTRLNGYTLRIVAFIKQVVLKRYDGTPESSSLMMLGVGVLGLAGFVLKRTR